MSTDATKPAGELWRFAVATYARDGVADACIALQDEQGADVNMLLFSVWFGMTRGRFAAAEFAAAAAYSRAWNEFAVAPLRAVRRWMKSDGCALVPATMDACLEIRDSIKANELNCEQIQLNALESTIAHRPTATLPVSDQLRHSVDNLGVYCESAGIDVDDRVNEKLAVLLLASVDSADLATIEAFLAS